jgi:hypothetical protein
LSLVSAALVAIIIPSPYSLSCFHFGATFSFVTTLFHVGKTYPLNDINLSHLTSALRPALSSRKTSIEK